MYLRETNQMDEAAQYEQYLRETGQEHAIGQATRQAEYQSGRLGRRMERLNTNDREMADAEIAAERNTSGLRGAGIRGLGAITALGRDIPGVEALQAGARAGASTLGERLGLPVEGQSYGEALGDIRSAQAEVNPVSRVGLRMIGGGLAAGALPGSQAAQGAKYGGLLNLLDAEPDKTFGERLLTGAVGAGLGGAFGKVTDVGGTMFRARRNPGYEELSAGLQNQRTAATRPLYAQAEREGFQNMTTPITPELDAALNEPDIARIVKMLQQNREFRDMPVNDPRFLSEISQALTDAQRRALMPTAADNLTDVAARNYGAAKQQFGEAVSGPRGPMPTFGGANAEYAAQSGLQDAMARGADAMSLGARSGNALSSLEALAERGPRSLLEYLKTASPQARELAVSGAEAALKRPLASGGVVGMVNPLRTVQRASILDGGNMLREMDKFRAPSTKRSFAQFLQNAGVAGATPAMNP